MKSKLYIVFFALLLLSIFYSCFPAPIHAQDKWRYEVSFDRPMKSGNALITYMCENEEGCIDSTFMGTFWVKSVDFPNLQKLSANTIVIFFHFNSSFREVRVTMKSFKNGILQKDSFGNFSTIQLLNEKNSIVYHSCFL